MRASGITITALLLAWEGGVTAHPAEPGFTGCLKDPQTGHFHCHGQGTPEAKANDERPGEARTVWFPNCTAARRAGYAPMRRGEPGYRIELDRDGDGVACEPYRNRR